MKEINVSEKVYDAVLGMYVNAEDYFIEGMEVKDLFLEGSICERHYEAVYKAKENLREILSDSAYDNVDTIAMCLDQISREVALKMFEYGVEYGRKNP